MLRTEIKLETRSHVDVYVTVASVCHLFYRIIRDRHFSLVVKRAFKGLLLLGVFCCFPVISKCLVTCLTGNFQAATERLLSEVFTLLKPNTHRRRRRDETVESRRVGGVYTNSQLVGVGKKRSNKTSLFSDFLMIHTPNPSSGCSAGFYD